MRILIRVLIALLIPVLTHAQSVDFNGNTLVKRAESSGICHPPGTIYYDRVKNFTQMTLTACLAMDGGRLPVQYQAYWAATAAATARSVDCTQLASSSDPACMRIAEEREIVEEKEEETKEFAGFRFGIGVAAMEFDEPVLDDVDIVDGIVFVREKRDVISSILFETHKFFTPTKGSPNFGFGPFVAASLTDEEGVNPLSTFGFGVMAGWKHEDSSGSWNIGIGWVVDTDALEFREGISDGAPTSITDSKDLTRTTDSSGILLMFSATW